MRIKRWKFVYLMHRKSSEQYDQTDFIFHQANESTWAYNEEQFRINFLSIFGL
jgi:hypothetical protein